MNDKLAAPAGGIIKRGHPMGVLVGSMIGLTLGYSTFVAVTFGLFVRPLEDAFGWSRSQISLALTISSTMVVLLGPLAGRMADKVGIRPVLLPSIALFGIGVGCFALLSDSLIHFYLMFFLVAVAGLGTLPSIYTRLIVEWFTTRRGIALGASLSGVGVGLIAGPPAIQSLISSLGWRGAYVGIAAMILLVSLPTAYLLLRNRLSSSSHTDGNGTKSGGQVEHSRLRALLADRAFLLMIAAYALLGIMSVGAVAHLPALLVDSGYSATAAAGFMSVFGIAVIIGRLSCGVLIDWFFAPVVLAVFLAGPLAAMIMLDVGNTAWLYYLAAVLLGLGFGAEFDVMSYLVSRYFALECYTGIYAYIYSAFTVGAALGPPLMGLSYDLAGHYGYGLWGLAASVGLSICLVLMLGPYRQALGTDGESNAVA